MLMLLTFMNRTISVPDHVLLFSALILVGLLVNGLVCGVLASPLGRFQARIIWVVPFLALTIAAVAALRGPVLRRGVIYVPSN